MRGEQLGAEGDVVLGRLGDLGVARVRRRRARSAPCRPRPGRDFRAPLQEQDALGQLARELVLLRGDLARELVAPGAEHVGPGLDRVLPAALAVDLEARRPSARRRGGRRSGRSSTSRQPSSLAGPCSGRPRGAGRGRRGRCRPRHRDGVADAALGGVAPPSTAGAGYWITIGGGGLAGLARRLGGESGALVVRTLVGGVRRVGRVEPRYTRVGGVSVGSREEYPSARSGKHAWRLEAVEVAADRAPALERRSAPITSLPGGRLGPEAYRFVDWLAAAGQTWWQMLPLGPPDRYRSPYKSRRRSRPGRAAGVAAGAGLGFARSLAFREREAYWVGDWERSAGRRRVGRPGAVRARVDALRAYAARARGAADRATWRSTWRPGAPTTARTPSCSVRRSWRARHRTRSPTTASCGATRCTTGRRCAATATAGGSSGCGARWRMFDLVRIDHFRGFVAYWAVPAGARTAAIGTLAARPGPGPVRRARRDELGSACRWWPRISG